MALLSTFEFAAAGSDYPHTSPSPPRRGASPFPSNCCNGGGQQYSLCEADAARAPASPLGASFAQKLRPLLDAVDSVRSLGVMDEGINLPTIVVVGDQSSGKSSVLESLAGVELPKGQGIVTRVPLVLRLQGTSLWADAARITIAYNDTETEIRQEDIPSALTAATELLAGPGKNIVDKPITLNVRRPGAPDLTLVDLPGITRVPVQGQPDDIYDTIAHLILRYITPDESIILNVLSAATDFSVCESIRMSRGVDKLGKRTLAAVTKIDLCPDGVLARVSENSVRVGLGYVCMRNKTDKDSCFEEASHAEKRLFSSHPELRKLDKSMVGATALADRLMRLQAQSITSLLPTILKQVDKTLEHKRAELMQLSAGISSAAEARIAFFSSCTGLKKLLEEVLVDGNAEPFEDEPELHFTARLHERFARFCGVLVEGGAKSLVEEEKLERLERLVCECAGTFLPNIVPQAVVEKVIRAQVDSVTGTCNDLLADVHEQAQALVLAVVAKHAAQFPNLRRLYNSLSEKRLNECRDKSFDTVRRLLLMEKSIIYCSDSYKYNETVRALASLEVTAPKSPMRRSMSEVQVKDGSTWVLEGVEVKVEDKALEKLSAGGKEALYSVMAYWAALGRRLAENVSRELRFSFNETMLRIPDAALAEVLGGASGQVSVEDVMAEKPEVMQEREKLRCSIDTLSKSRTLVYNALGSI